MERGAGKVKIGLGAAVVNNNPGNLRYARQPKAEPGYKGFARFPTPEDGMEALVRQIEWDASNKHTLRTFIYKYAPPEDDNDTRSYLRHLVRCTGKAEGTLLASMDLRKLAECVAWHESRTTFH